MLRNYFLTTLRALLKQRFYAFINVVGLSVGIAACLIILLYVTNEFSFDRFHEKGDRIYRVNQEIKFGSNHFHVAGANPALAPLFYENYPEIETIVRIRYWGDRYVRRADSEDRIKEVVCWADSTFFNVFSVPVLEGDARTPLHDPHSVVISESTAHKYFPNGNAVGQNLVIDQNSNYRVSAVYKDLPENSHFHFDVIRPIHELDDMKSVSLIGGGDCSVYLLLKENTNARALEAKFPDFVVRYVGPQIAEAVGGDPKLEKFKSSGNIWEYTLTNIHDIHLHSALLGEFEANGNITYVYLFSAIALFILVIACINFMNLSTARATNRAKEVGVRKVLGSQRQQLIRQFLSESFLLTLVSFFFAVAFAYFFLPVFNNLAGRQLALPFGEVWFYGLMLFAVGIVALFAGMYPAFFLSAFKPAAVLKSKVALGGKNSFVRSGLVVFQFVISIFLIIATITVNQQLRFIQNKQLGFDKDQLIVVKDAFNLRNNLQPFKEEVKRNSAILAATVSGFLPVEGGRRNGDTFWAGEQPPSQTDVNDMVNVQKWQVDYDYINAYQMKMKAGREFSQDFPSDSTAVILNETAVQRFKLVGDPIGQKISHFGDQTKEGKPDPDKIETWTIIGVVQDFHFESMKDNIGPLGFYLQSSTGSVVFRFDPKHTAEVVALLESTWKKMASGSPFQYSFLDDDFGRMYSSEVKLGKIFGLFAMLAIVIACLGLLALTAFTAEQRTKEIGIRKALGASVNSIVLLLSKDFGRLILIAFVLAVPGAWYAVRLWLEGYAYKTTIGLPVYVMAGALTLFVAFLTMSYQSIKAARSNPVDSLRME